MGNKVISFDSGEQERKSYAYTYADVSLVSELDFARQIKGNMAPEAAESSQNYRITKKLDVDAVKGAVRNIFSWTPGERIIEPEFGNTIRRLLYEGITEYNSEQIVNECKMLMTRWEPRAAIDRIFKKDSVEETENNQITIIMIWHVLGLPDQQYQTEVII